MMRSQLRKTTCRRGAIIPLAAFCMVGFMVLLALAIDIGMIAVSRSQCQNAADTAAMAGARTANGDSATNYNFSAIPGGALDAALANQILGQYVNDGKKTSLASVNAYTYLAGQVLVEVGSYTYEYNDGDASKEKFTVDIPRKDTNEPYSAVRATVQRKSDYFFARVMGMPPFTTSATAVAVHRPRDVIIVMDLSGSMRFQSLPGIPINGTDAEPSSVSRPRTLSMNPEAFYPKFGAYSDTAAAALYGNTTKSTGEELVDPANISATTNSGPPVIEDFHNNALGVAPSSGTRAFKRAPDTQETTPGGDNYLRTVNNTAGNPYAKTVNEILNGVAGKDLEFERKGYEAYVAKFNGYTEGPGYWGKTFFIWPPDPRGSTLDPTNSANYADNGAKDWRQRFFFKVNNSTGTLGWLDHTNILMDGSGTPADNSSTAPGTPVMKVPNSTTTTVTENGVSVTYKFRINYAAILHWLRNQAPQPFPTVLRGGRIKYYDAIPDPSDTGLNNRWWTTFPLTNINERFWKDYIDFVLGFQGTAAGTYTRRNVDPNGTSLSSVPLSALIGNGDYFRWGTVSIPQKPDNIPVKTGTVNKSGGYAAGATTLTVSFSSAPAAGSYIRFNGNSGLYKLTGSPTTTSITLDAGLTGAVANGDTVKVYTTFPKSLNYDGNPFRPRHQFWFGPMTFVDYLGNYNTTRFWWPGNVHEAQCWACKVGIQTAISDIQKNHPNDFIGMAYFSSPSYAANNNGQHNHARVPLGRNYQQLRDSLWFPPSTVTGGVTEITPYDDDFIQVPRAKGGTAPGMGLMIAYNLLSSSTTNLRFYSQPQPQKRGAAGGLGRKGAQRVIIFETDGAPNTGATASMGGSGKDAYYKVRLSNPAKYTDGANVEWPSAPSYSDTDVYNVVKQICALDSASPPGYSTTRKPALVYSIGYGTLFDPANSSATQTNALTFLQTVAYHGKTAGNTSASSFPDARRIYGTNQQRIDRIQNAFTEIMQNGVQVSLIE